MRLNAHLPDRFELGQLVATPGAIRAMAEAHSSGIEYLRRHQTGDWGDLDAEDKQINEDSVRDGLRILSAYRLPDTGVKIWVITEADRSVTTILLPEEY